MRITEKWSVQTACCSLILLIIVLLLITSTALANGTENSAGSGVSLELRCGTPDVTQTVAEQIQKKIAPLLQNRNSIRGGVFQIEGFPLEGVIIPVAFHVIHSGQEGKLTEFDIVTQIDVLNDAYSGTGVQFMLAEIDYTDNPEWFGIESNSKEMSDAKASLTVDSSRYLNIYTTLLEEDLLGFATFPNEQPENPEKDGLVLLYQTLPGGESDPYNNGDTAVHEIGHWLGLYHTFQTFIQNIITPPIRTSANLIFKSGCLGPGDYVDDTPAERSPSGGCNEFRNTCVARPGRDPIKNYMDYSPDSCMDEFTPGQVERLQAMIVKYRPGLIDTSTATTSVPNNPSITTTTVIGAPGITTTSIMGGSSTCDFNEGVSKLWDWFNHTVPSMNEYPIPAVGWELYIHPEFPSLYFLHPPDWEPTSISDQANTGVILIRNDGSAIFQILITSDTSGILDIDQWLDNNVAYVLGLIGEDSPVNQRCLLEGQSSQAQGILTNAKDIAVTAGETTLVAAIAVTSISALPLTQISFETMAGPSSEFTTLTEEVFFPIILQMLY